MCVSNVTVCYSKISNVFKTLREDLQETHGYFHQISDFREHCTKYSVEVSLKFKNGE